MSYFSTILIANRGEIAVRVIRACRALGIEAVAVYSEADQRALHVREADRAILIGPAAASQSYLNSAAILAAAQRSGAQALHPGYGFLSENAAFARACAAAGLVFIGPPAAAIELMGSKIAAKRLAEQAGVPIVPGYSGADQALERLQAEAELVGYPLLIKASAGGGGKGMRTVQAAGEFAAALAAAQREAQAAFGDASVLLERLIERPRHIEFQIMADHYGTTVHLGERECSIQRRHQKIIEESPSPALTPELRTSMGAAAVRLAEAVSYRNAGTQEFMLDQQGHFYFLEMNTRLQVEHPVTEEVTGIDLVQTQIAVAAGERLPFSQAEINQHGHAIEVRLYAEDPTTMLPAIGTLSQYRPPEGPGVRLDTGVAVGDPVTINYDPMLAKLIIHGADRAQAVARLRYALDTFEVAGVTTNLPLLAAIVAEPAFAAGETYTDFLTIHPLAEQLGRPAPTPLEVLAAAVVFELTLAPAAATVLPANPWLIPWRSTKLSHHLRYQTPAGDISVLAVPLDELSWQVAAVASGAEQLVVDLLRRNAGKLVLRIDQTIHHATLVADGLTWDGRFYALKAAPPPSVEALSARAGSPGQANLAAPMPGTLIKVLVDVGQAVAAGQPLIILEAMKMEHTISAPHAGVVIRLPYAQGAQVAGGAVLVALDEADHD